MLFSIQQIYLEPANHADSDFRKTHFYREQALSEQDNSPEQSSCICFSDIKHTSLRILPRPVFGNLQPSGKKAVSGNTPFPQILKSQPYTQVALHQFFCVYRI